MISHKFKKWLERRFIAEKTFWLLKAAERAELIKEFNRGEK